MAVPGRSGAVGGDRVPDRVGDGALGAGDVGDDRTGGIQHEHAIVRPLEAFAIPDAVHREEVDALPLALAAAALEQLVVGVGRLGGEPDDRLAGAPRGGEAREHVGILHEIGAMRRVLAVVVYSVVGGLVLTGILAGWFGALQGDFWVEVGVIALALAAIAAPITGAVAILGRAGIAVGPIVMMLFANPISGAAMPREFLPGAWGEIGQWFPPGAAANLLRDVSYFPTADATFSWLVLAGWTVGGLLLSVIGHFRTAGGAEPDAIAAHEDDPVPVTV